MKLINSILFTALLFACSLSAHAQWIPAGSLSSSSDYVREMTQSSTGTIVASSWNVGLFRSTNNGTSWAKTSFTGNHAHRLAVSPQGHFFALNHTTSSISIHRSTNDGLDWQQVYFASHANNFALGGGIMFADNNTIIAGISFTMGPTVGDIGAEIIKSTNAGANWNLVTIFNAAGFINDMEISNSGKMYAGTSLGGMVASTNGGINWAATPFQHYIGSIKKNSKGTLFAGITVADNTTPKVWSSTNDGAEWLPLGLPQSSTMDLHIDNEDAIIVSLDNKQVYISTNEGSTWELKTSGIPSNQFVYSLAGSTGSFVFAGTGSSGVYKYSDNPSGVNGSGIDLNGFELAQNYPNPFNPSTVINFSLPAKAFVTLKVYDMLGREKSILASSDFTAGEHSISFNAESLPGGIYFYTLTSSSETGISTETKKMILAK